MDWEKYILLLMAALAVVNTIINISNWYSSRRRTAPHNERPAPVIMQKRKASVATLVNSVSLIVIGWLFLTAESTRMIVLSAIALVIVLVMFAFDIALRLLERK